MTTVEDFFNTETIKSATFPVVGATVQGVIAKEPHIQQQRDLKSNQPLTWDSGDPKWQVRVILATTERDPGNPEDNGERALYVKGAMKGAVEQAIKASGAKALKVGGVLQVTYIGDGERSNPAFNPPKLYAARYQHPVEYVQQQPMAQQAQVSPAVTPQYQLASSQPGAQESLSPEIAALQAQLAPQGAHTR